MAFQNFYELDAWKTARSFKVAVNNLTRRFPDHEKYELTSQLRRSVRSIPANISEGHGRKTFKDQYNFCVIARGSHSETLNHLIDAYDNCYISQDELVQLQKQWDELGKVLNGYMSYLQSRMTGGSNSTQIIKEGLIPYSTGSELNDDPSDFFAHLTT